MFIIFLIPIVLLFIIWERKKLIYFEYVLNKSINIKKKYTILFFVSYLVGISVFFLFVSFLSEEQNYANIYLVLLTPLYIAMCSILLLLYEYMLAIVQVFLEHSIINKILCKYYKLSDKELVIFYKESDEHPFKYYFYSNCVVTLYVVVLSTLMLVFYKLALK